MAEWLIASVLKTDIVLTIEGSNPSLSLYLITKFYYFYKIKKRYLGYLS